MMAHRLFSLNFPKVMSLRLVYSRRESARQSLCASMEESPGSIGQGAR